MTEDKHVRTATTNGQITIPKEYRDRYGDTYEIREDDGGLKFIPLVPTEG